MRACADAVPTEGRRRLLNGIECGVAAAVSKPLSPSGAVISLTFPRLTSPSRPVDGVSTPTGRTSTPLPSRWSGADIHGQPARERLLPPDPLVAATMRWCLGPNEGPGKCMGAPTDSTLTLPLF